MQPHAIRRIAFSALSGGLLVCAAAPAWGGSPEHQEHHFAVKAHPFVVLQNIVNGRIEVKSWKNPEVVVSSTSAPGKVAIDIEKVGDRIEINANSLETTAEPHEVEANFQLTVPEQTELQLRTQTGLIYVEQVSGDMKLQSVAGDVHLKEVSGYIIVKTTGGTLICTQCAGKLEFTSISGNVQILQPALTSVNLMTTTGNIPFDLKAQTLLGTVDNQAAAFVKPDTHGSHHSYGRFSKGLFGTVGLGLAKVELSSYSGTIRILKRD